MDSVLRGNEFQWSPDWRRRTGYVFPVHQAVKVKCISVTAQGDTCSSAGWLIQEKFVFAETSDSVFLPILKFFSATFATFVISLSSSLWTRAPPILTHTLEQGRTTLTLTCPCFCVDFVFNVGLGWERYSFTVIGTARRRIACVLLLTTQRFSGRHLYFREFAMQNPLFCTLQSEFSKIMFSFSFTVEERCAWLLVSALHGKMEREPNLPAKMGLQLFTALSFFKYVPACTWKCSFQALREPAYVREFPFCPQAISLCYLLSDPVITRHNKSRTGRGCLRQWAALSQGRMVCTKCSAVLMLIAYTLQPSVDWILSFFFFITSGSCTYWVTVHMILKKKPSDLLCHLFSKENVHLCFLFNRILPLPLGWQPNCRDDKWESNVRRLIRWYWWREVSSFVFRISVFDGVLSSRDKKPAQRNGCVPCW